MGSLGVMAVVLLLVLLAVAVPVIRIRRRRRPAPGQPRTVADLVRMRGGAEDGGVTESDEPASVPAVIPPRAPADDLDLAADDDGPRPARDRDLVGAGLVLAEAERVEAADRSGGAAPAPAPDSAADTPWARAARMNDGDGVVVPAARSPRHSAPEMTTTAVEERSNSHGVHLACVDDDDAAPPAVPGPTSAAAGPAADESEVATPAVAEPADVEPAVAEVATPALAEPADVEPAVAAPAVAEPAAVEPAAVEPAVAAPAVAEPPPPGAALTPPTAVERAADGSAAAEPAAAQLPAARTPEVVDREPDPPLPPEPIVSTPARTAGRVRRPAAETEAEQAAADLALLRTFGIAGPPGRPPEPDDEETELAVRSTGPAGPAVGAAQAVRVHVVGRTGDGLAGAVVTLHDDLGRETESVPADDGGHATLVAPNPGGYVLVAVADGHQPGAAALTVDDAAVEAEIVLTRSASLSGVVAGDDGPQAGATVVLVQDGETLDGATTGPDGLYSFAGLTAGEYGLSVIVPDCEPAAVLVRVSDEQQVRLDVELDPAGLPEGVL